MKPEDVQTIEILVEGWMFGVMTCLLYAVISNYREIKRRNLRHKILLDAGHDPLDILLNDHE